MLASEDCKRRFTGRHSSGSTFSKSCPSFLAPVTVEREPPIHLQQADVLTMAASHEVDLSRRVLSVCVNGRSEGTAFLVGARPLALTASHVVRDSAPQEISVVSHQQSQVIPCPVTEVIHHSTADVAALKFDEQAASWPRNNPNNQALGLDCFRCEPRIPYLGSAVRTFSYANVMPDDREGEARLMTGHVQRFCSEKYRGHVYSAIEIGLFSFPGFSGSPIILLDEPDLAIGVVTNGIYLLEPDACLSPGEVPGPLWATGALLAPLATWVASVATG